MAAFVLLFGCVLTLPNCREVKPGGRAYLDLDEILESSMVEGWTVLAEPSVEGPFRVGTEIQTAAPGEPLRSSFHSSGKYYQFYYSGNEGAHIRAISLETKDGKLYVLALRSTESKPSTDAESVSVTEP